MREALVAGTTVVIAALGARRIDVQFAGKAGTFCNLFAFPLFLASESTISWDGIARGFAWAFVAVGIPLSWYAAALYVPLARDALREGRAARVGDMP